MSTNVLEVIHLDSPAIIIHVIVWLNFGNVGLRTVFTDIKISWFRVLEGETMDL